MTRRLRLTYLYYLKTNSFIFGTTVKFDYFGDINFEFPLGSPTVGSTEELVLGHDFGSDFSIDVFRFFHFLQHSNTKNSGCQDQRSQCS